LPDSSVLEVIKTSYEDVHSAGIPFRLHKAKQANALSPSTARRYAHFVAEFAHHSLQASEF